MAFPRRLKDLCTPSMIYFIFSMIGLIIVLFQNVGNRNMYRIGNFTCRVPNTILTFLMKLIYILFWTWVLNLICKDGHEGISWFLVLLPWIFMLVLIAMIMINQ